MSPRSEWAAWCVLGAGCGFWFLLLWSLSR